MTTPKDTDHNNAQTPANTTVPADQDLLQESGLPANTGLALTKLTLAGFKSFADKTTFTFDDPITGIVGPNGCGKSNVVDAIKWVLGERSSKSLRGKEMIDCIFAGSSVRKPAGMAAVTLSFDNPKSAAMLATLAGQADTEPHEVIVEDVEQTQKQNDSDVQTESDTQAEAETHTAHDEHISDEEADQAVSDGESEAASIITERRRIARPLPIDADQVEVQRRLYRDGKSQYLINGKLARLKDIRDLFLDTGIGADAYSIIEQGKVDRMLLASPMERRVIFEEAAGIAKYRQRRVEAQRKLDKAESNLAVTREQLDSTERRLRMVKGQAAKARRFRELDDEYRAQRLALGFEQYDDIRRRLEGLTSQIASLEDERIQTQSMLEQAEESHNIAKEHRLIVGRELRETENALTNAKHQAESANQRQEMTLKAIDDAAHLVETETTRMTEASTKLLEIDTLIGDHSQKLESLRAELASSEATLQETSTQREQASRKLNEHRQRVDETRSVVASVEREHATLLTRVESDDRRIESITERVNELSQRLNALQAEIKHAQHESTGAVEALALLNQKIVESESQLQELDQRVESLDSSRGNLAKHVNQLDEDRVRLQTRHATLDEMVKSRVGLDDAVRAVLEMQEQGQGFTGVIGPLAELIEAKSSEAPHIEAALEDTLQALVVESMDAMPTPEEIASLPGRVTLLPLTTDSSPITNTIPHWLTDATNGRVARLRDAVHARSTDSRIESLLDRLLGNSLLVTDVDSAALLGAGPLASIQCRFVTRDGIVLESDGRIIAGTRSGSESEGLLGRQSELQSLVHEIDALLTELNTEKSNLARIDSDAAGLGERRSALHSKLNALRDSRVRTEHIHEKHNAEIERLGRDVQRGIDEQHTHETRLEESRVQRHSLTTKAGQLERLLSEQRSTLTSLQSDLGTFESTVEQVNETSNAARVAVSTAHEQVRSETRHLSSLTTSKDEIERSNAQAQSMIERSRANLDEHKRVAQEAHEEQLKAHALIESLETSMHEQADVVRIAEEAVTTAQNLMSQARDQAEAFNRDWHAVESSRRETEVKRETIEERTLEDLEVDLLIEYPEYRYMMDDGGVERIDVTSMTASVNVLKGEIKNLGNVNLNSIDEESNLTERNDSLIAQVRDIDEARIKLATLIEKLNVASRARFSEVFDRIKDEFGGRNGMFRRLFGGGRAEVRLMPLVKEVDGQKVVTDEIDVLESGIEVIAKPPGKEPRSINQLSGGEKTMTAVAMLLAIFRSKPSCFCVLDEVDAALDEANVGRFCATLDLFALQSRFIVITHNKRTMQATNKLFGVTMQERGVSKRVEVRFDQVAEDGTIDEQAVKDAPSEATQQEHTHQKTKPGNESSTKPSGALRAALASMREDDSTIAVD
ncbi:MAG: chromosome segregation protein SMC [Phycisphaerales bacterium]